MPLNDVHGAGVETVVASYDFQELTTGNGILTLYPADLGGNTDAASHAYMLTNQSDYVSNTGFYRRTGAATWDNSFSITINRPMTLIGDVTFDIMHGYNGSATAQRYYHVALQKVSDGVISHICSSAVYMRILATGNTFFPIAAKASTEAVKIKEGDILRLYIEGVAIATAGGDIDDVGTDPTNRASLTASLTLSNSRVYVPVRLPL